VALLTVFAVNNPSPSAQYCAESEAKGISSNISVKSLILLNFVGKAVGDAAILATILNNNIINVIVFYPGIV
jgi:hypothetical protein